VTSSLAVFEATIAYW